MNVFILSIIVILSIISVNGGKYSKKWKQDEKEKSWKKKDCDCKEKKDWAKVPDPDYVTYGICYIRPSFCKGPYCYVVSPGVTGVAEGFIPDEQGSDPDEVDVEGDNDATDVEADNDAADVEADDDRFVPFTSSSIGGNGDDILTASRLAGGRVMVAGSYQRYVQPAPCRFGEVVAFVTKTLKHGYILPFGFKPWDLVYKEYKRRQAAKHRSSWYKQDHYEGYDGGYSKRGGKHGGNKYGDGYDGGDKYDGGDY